MSQLGATMGLGHGYVIADSRAQPQHHRFTLVHSVRAEGSNRLINHEWGTLDDGHPAPFSHALHN